MKALLLCYGMHFLLSLPLTSWIKQPVVASRELIIHAGHIQILISLLVNVSYLMFIDQSLKKLVFLGLGELTPYYWNLLGSRVQISLVYAHPRPWQVRCVLDSSIHNLKHILTKAGLVADMSHKCSGEFTTTPNVLPEANCHGGKKMKYVTLKKFVQ